MYYIYISISGNIRKMLVVFLALICAAFEWIFLIVFFVGCYIFSGGNFSDSHLSADDLLHLRCNQIAKSEIMGK